MFNWFTNLFKAKVHQPLPVGHTIEVPYIRCVAQQMLISGNLNTKNISMNVLVKGKITRYIGMVVM